MREKRKTFEVEEKEEDVIYCDICGAKTDDWTYAYIEDDSEDSLLVKEIHPGMIGWNPGTIHNPRISDIDNDLVRVYYASRHEVCSVCANSLDGGVKKDILPVKSESDVSRILGSKQFFKSILSSMGVIAEIIAVVLMLFSVMFGHPPVYLIPIPFVFLILVIYLEIKTYT